MILNTDYITTDVEKISSAKSKKKQIILAHSSCSRYEFLTKIETRYNKKYNKLPTFFVDLEGNVYNLYDSAYYSNFMEDPAVNKMNISVMLENAGWLRYDARDEQYYDWKNTLYVGDVVEKEWRAKKHWATYSPRQIDSLMELIDHLCKKHKIPAQFTGDNMILHKPLTFKGVMTRGNYSKNYYDLSPAMDFTMFNEDINKLANH